MSRRALDRYLTPDWATRALIIEFPEISGGRLLDPCCGDGRMAALLASRFSAVLLNDIQPNPSVNRWNMDARNVELYAEARPDWVITNPPFLAAGGIAWTAIHHAAVGVALLLRCTFMEPVESRSWLQRMPPTAILALPRISFTGDGATDSAPCWWFIWSPRVRPRVVVRGREESAGQLSLTPSAEGSSGAGTCSARRPGSGGSSPREWAARGAPVSDRLEIVPCELDEANAFVAEHHRHHRPVVGHRFSIAAAVGDKVVGVAIVGRPTARRLNDGWTLEVTRLATDGTKNACSALYAAAWRAARAIGYRRVVTFTLDSEPGTSLVGAGWKVVGTTPGRSWSVPSRPRVDKHPLQPRLRWEISK